MSKNQPRGKKQTVSNKRRWRVILVFVFAFATCIAIGGAFLIFRDLVYPDMYYVLLFDLIGMVGLYMGAIFLCAFFLYLFFIIVFINPQRIKRSKVLKFAAAGMVVFIFTVWVVGFSSQEISRDSQAFQDYKEGNWTVKELLVRDIYGPNKRSNITILETDEGDMVLYWRPFRIYRDQIYRFTYLDKTKVVLEVEQVGE
ncbi:hypothetical protein [Sutcliffiella cohnii]|uniref:hypothetical protein n=1 Tax=Sutcliffiella cohnii TaxID=33932 RepID=UPI002E24A8EF|nr:hypothetical protein [Sutcliffiella cohnii]